MAYRIEREEPVFADINCRQIAYRELFLNSDLGKSILKDLLNECSIGRTAFNNDSSEQTYYNLGKQHIGYHINNLLNIQLQEIKDHE